MKRMPPSNARLFTSVIFLAVAMVCAAQAPGRAPILTVPKMPGQEAVRLASMDLTAHIVGMHAETTATMTFYNPNARVLEGELLFPLPDGAAVTGYALDVKGVLVDGVVVKKEQARVAFETEVRKGVDPGIVEQVAGNLYRTRLYPLPAHGSRIIRIRYLSTLASSVAGEVACRLPLPLGQTIGKLSLRVEVVQGEAKPRSGGFGNLSFDSFKRLWVASGTWSNVVPGEDILVSLPSLPEILASVEKTASGEYYAAISHVRNPDGSPAAAAKAAVPTKLGIAWDASASRVSASIDKELAFLEALLSRWGNLEVTLIVFRNKPEKPRTFVVRNGYAEGLAEALRAAPFDGGTDLPALSAAMNKAAPEASWLLFTDGIDTLASGEADFKSLSVSAVVSQGVAERELLRQVCTASSAASGGQLLDLSRMEPSEAADIMERPPARLVHLRGEGLEDIEGLGAPADGRLTVHARLSIPKTTVRLEYSDGYLSPPILLSRVDADTGNILAAAWAAARVTRLSARASANAGELLALGRRFGIVSPETSLIVLESLEQYVLHDIRPPDSLPEMRRLWDAAQKASAVKEAASREDKIARVVQMWGDRLAWWNTEFSFKPVKTLLPEERPMSSTLSMVANPGERMMFDLARRAEDMALANRSAESAQADRPPAMAMMAASAAPSPDPATAMAAATAATGGSTADTQVGQRESQAAIAIKAWDPKVPYLDALKAAGDKPGKAYAAYLTWIDKSWRGSPSFYLDCAGFFFDKGQAALGVQILSNLAELKLEDASLLRVLAWRLAQQGEFDFAVRILRKVALMRPEEPQSLRDLALVLADRAKADKDPASLAEAMSLLYKTVTADWTRASQFPEIEVIALEELNALMALHNRETWARPAAIPDLDPRLRQNLDLGVRIVLSWDADNTDIDLHVIEPTGDEAYFSQALTRIGGLVSKDFIRGYGPEEYLLRKPMPGTYRIIAKYYGSTQQSLTGPVTVTATVFTDFGRQAEQRKTLTLRLDKVKGMVTIGEIAIGTTK